MYAYVGRIYATLVVNRDSGPDMPLDAKLPENGCASLN
jgi:hypothetical protein